MFFQLRLNRKTVPNEPRDLIDFIMAVSSTTDMKIRIESTPKPNFEHLHCAGTDSVKTRK